MKLLKCRFEYEEMELKKKTISQVYSIMRTRKLRPLEMFLAYELARQLEDERLINIIVKDHMMGLNLGNVESSQSLLFLKTMRKRLHTTTFEVTLLEKIFELVKRKYHDFDLLQQIQFLKVLENFNFRFSKVKRFTFIDAWER